MQGRATGKRTRYRHRMAGGRNIALQAYAAAALLLTAACAAVILWKGAFSAVIGIACPSYAVLESATYLPRQSAAPAAKPLAIASEREETAVAVSAAIEPAIPRILIYHTHATEAYLMTQEDAYTPSGSWRTDDAEKSVVAIGELLARLLSEQYGIGVVHDTKDYEPPKLSSAYSRSLAAMETYQRRYPTITMFIDVHRDAYGTNEDGTPQDFVTLSGAEVARLMCVVGTGEGATGSGFGEMPDFSANHALAQKITDRLREADDRLARDIRVKTGRYNQHVSNACLLIEVGHTANTLTQAKNAVPYLAEAVAAAYREMAAPTEVSDRSVWSPAA